MNNSALKLVQKPKRATKADLLSAEQEKNIKLSTKIEQLQTQVHTLENPEQSEVVEAVKIAFNKRNRMAAFWGLSKGGWAPLASYFVAHKEIGSNYYQPLTLLVLGALLFSAPTVYEWCMAAFNNRAKAIGFVVLLEGVMVFSHIPWLGISALILLISINGIQSACNLAIRRKKPEFSF